jgi:hypothetical protein
MRIRSAFPLGLLFLVLACSGGAGHKDGGVSSTDGALDVVASPDAAPTITADAGASLVEAAILVIMDSAADRAAMDVPVDDSDAVSFDALPDVAVETSLDDDEVSQPAPADGGEDGAAFDLATVLPGKTLIYWITAAQQRPDGGGFLSRTPNDQDFAAVAPVRSDTVIFSDDGSSLQIAGVQPGSFPRTGTRISTDGGKWSYSLRPAPGGRFDVWIAGNKMAASKLIPGSGVPVIESDRGELRDN